MTSPFVLRFLDWDKGIIALLSGKEGDEKAGRLPPGQRAIKSILKWGIEHPGIVQNLPKIDKEDWPLRVEGEVENPFTLDWKSLLSMPQVTSKSGFHCVEGGAS